MCRRRGCAAAPGRLADGAGALEAFVSRTALVSRNSCAGPIFRVRILDQQTGDVTRVATPIFRSPWIAPVALLLAAASLGANGVLLYKLRRPERMLAPALDRVASRLQASSGTIKYTVRIPAGTPVSFDVPIDQSYTIKLRTQIPINTTVRVPVSTPFGNRQVSIPVRTNIPIRQDLPVHLIDTFHLRTRTQAEYVVPLEIKLKDLPLDALRQTLQP